MIVRPTFAASLNHACAKRTMGTITDVFLLMRFVFYLNRISGIGILMLIQPFSETVQDNCEDSTLADNILLSARDSCQYLIADSLQLMMIIGLNSYEILSWCFR